MRAMKARGAAMTKGALAEALATQMDLKKSVCGKVIGTLAEIGAGEVKSTGIFTLSGLCRIKTRVKPATKAGKDGRQGFRRCGPEAEHLSFCPIGAQVACSSWGCLRSRSKLERIPELRAGVACTFTHRALRRVYRHTIPKRFAVVVAVPRHTR